MNQVTYYIERIKAIKHRANALLKKAQMKPYANKLAEAEAMAFRLKQLGLEHKIVMVIYEENGTGNQRIQFYTNLTPEEANDKFFLDFPGQDLLEVRELPFNISDD